MPARGSARARVAAQIEALSGLLGDPWSEDPRLASYRTAIEGAERARKRPPARDAFFDRAEAFLAASRIAHRCRERDDPWQDLACRAGTKFAVESIRLGHVHTVSGLRDLETALLTEWNESTGPRVDRFWREVAAAKLPYARRDVLEEIFAAGRIRTREHYELAIDLLSEVRPAARERALSAMIGAYESRRR